MWPIFLEKPRFIGVPPVVEPRGFEPTVPCPPLPCKSTSCEPSQPEDTQIDSHDSGKPCPELARLVKKWPSLPEHVRKTIATLADLAGK